jgi:membrane-associated phospholipid phosphatase
MAARGITTRRLQAALRRGACRPSGPLLAAGACAAGATLVWTASFHVPIATRIDAHAMIGFQGLQYPLGRLSAPVVSLVDRSPFALAAALVIGVAGARRRPPLAVAAAATLCCANATSQVLKVVLAVPRGWNIDAESWPSGHATAATSLALCVVLVVPVRWRPVAGAAAGVFVVAAGYSILIAGGHFASDVLGGLLIAGMWMAGVIAALRALDARWPVEPAQGAALRPREVLWPTVLALGATTTAALAVATVRVGDVLEFIGQHPTFVFAAFGIAAIGVALAAATSLALTRGC